MASPKIGPVVTSRLASFRRTWYINKRMKRPALDGDIALGWGSGVGLGRGGGGGVLTADCWLLIFLEVIVDESKDKRGLGAEKSQVSHPVRCN